VFHFKVRSNLGFNLNLDAKKLKFNDVKERYMNVLNAFEEDKERNYLGRILKLSLKTQFQLEDLSKTAIERKEALKVVNLLVKQNLLCSLGEGTYRLHSTLVKTFVKEYLEN
jgi:hypothetical protein